MDISTTDMRYSPKARTLSASVTGPYPASVFVRSHRTGRVVEFFQNWHLAEQNEFWDGEMYVYAPRETCGIESLTLYRGDDFFEGCRD